MDKDKALHEALKLCFENIPIPSGFVKDDGKLHDIPETQYSYHFLDDETLVITDGSLTVRKFDVSGDQVFALLGPTRSGTSQQFFLKGGSCLEQGRKVQWLIKSWLPHEACVCHIIGKSGSGKTFVVLDWALSIATGEVAWNRYKVTPGNVAYLCGEGAQGIRARVSAWCQYHCQEGKEWKKLLDEHFVRTITSTKLNDPECLRKVKEELGALSFSPDLVVIDTLRTFFEGNENDSTEASRFNDSCLDLATEYNCPVLVVHHVGWSQQEGEVHGRGSTAFRGALDREFLVNRISKDQLVLSTTKVKDGADPDPVTLDLCQVQIEGWTDDDGEPVTSVILKEGIPRTPEKTDREVQDEELLINAFIECGFLDGEGYPYIKRDLLKKYLTGKLTTGTGEPLKAEKIKDQLNPKQKGRYINRLLNWGFIETVLSSGSEIPDGWRLTDQEASLRVKKVLTSQPDLSVS